MTGYRFCCKHNSESCTACESCECEENPDWKETERNLADMAEELRAVLAMLREQNE